MVKSFSAGVSCFQLFSGLSGGPWQARKYSVWRDGCRSLPGFRFYHRRLWNTGSPEHPKPSLRAERSNPSCSKESLDCFRLRPSGYGGQVVASAPRNDGKIQTQLPALAARRARGFEVVFAPLEKRGRRECRMHAAPAVSCAMCTGRCAHEHTGQRRQSDIPCAMALRLMPRSPRRRIRLASVASRMTAKVEPGWVPSPSQSLAPATGARTTRFCRTQQRRSSGADRSLTAPRQSSRPPCNPSRAQRHRVHRSPHSTYRDDAYAPLHEAG
jgi:hypothetical protein